MGDEFDPLTLAPRRTKRPHSYHGPGGDLRVLGQAWSVSGDRLRTSHAALVQLPIMAVKTLTVKAWAHQVPASASEPFDVEEHDARMAPDVPQIVGIRSLRMRCFSPTSPCGARTALKRERVFSPGEQAEERRSNCRSWSIRSGLPGESDRSGRRRAPRRIGLRRRRVDDSVEPRACCNDAVA